MLKVYYGFKRAFTSILLGFILAPLLKYILNYYDLAEFIILFYLISFIGIYLLFKKMKFWSIWYSLGWIIGILIFYQLLDRIELIFYIIIFIIAIVYNNKNKIKRKLRKI